MNNLNPPLTKQNVSTLVFRIFMLVTPQVIGIVFLNWNWCEVVSLYLLQFLAWCLIDVIIIQSKPKRLFDITEYSNKSGILSEYKFINIVWVLLYGTGIFYLMGRYDPEALAQLDFIGILASALVFFVINFITAWSQNVDKKMSEIDFGSETLASIVVTWLTIFLSIFATWLFGQNENTIWINLLISEVIVEVWWFYARKKGSKTRIVFRSELKIK